MVLMTASSLAIGKPGNEILFPQMVHFSSYVAFFFVFIWSIKKIVLTLQPTIPLL